VTDPNSQIFKNETKYDIAQIHTDKRGEEQMDKLNYLGDMRRRRC
jgi:hypothetical protein